ncbi:glutathione S-transferase III [Aureobasidium sp. EXF-3400]|nr:glutathione S-transferase III [Aureobasidium sp. EXF-12344]KAI4779782.1 glutathione S-transferase III [Aureobasidium sp. EXF-3400]
MTIRLHGSKLSTCTQRVMLVLNELELPHEFVAVDMGKGEHKTLEFVRDLHPFGKLPAFEDGNLHLFESRAICKYLVAKYANSCSVLWPPEPPEDIAMFEQAASVEYSYFDTSISKLAYEKLFKQFFGRGEPDPAVVRGLEAQFGEVLDYYEKLLSRQPYVTGSNVSLVDLYHLPWLYFLPRLSMEDEISSRENVAAWYQKMQRRSAWEKVACP